MDATPRMKVLIIDDEPDIIRVLQLRLEKEEFDVASAPNGQQGLEKLVSEKPDAILLDIRMPAMDGIAVLEQIRKIDRELPVFILTADDDIQPFEDAKRLNASGFIIKSKDIHQEIRNITSAIRLSPKYRQQK
jgi:two-component system OmpR family response regulator